MLGKFASCQTGIPGHKQRNCMSAKSSYFNKYGQIIWNRWDLAGELRTLATYNIYNGTYVTSPTTLRLAQDALTFARRNGIVIQPWGKFDQLLDDPETLMEYHNAKMFELSRAEDTTLILTRSLKQEISPFVTAGIHYALLTQKSIIADPSPDDRMAIALGTIHQRECYPCLLVFGKDKRNHWTEAIHRLLPNDVRTIDA